MKTAEESVDIMIRSSRQIISDLIGYGVRIYAKGRRTDLYQGGRTFPAPDFI